MLLSFRLMSIEGHCVTPLVRKDGISLLLSVGSERAVFHLALHRQGQQQHTMPRRYRKNLAVTLEIRTKCLSVCS